jgi:hypothetical protein
VSVIYLQNSFLFRGLPYNTAVKLDPVKILVLPFLALLIPLFRIAPPLYQWRGRPKIYRWYTALREIDTLIQPSTSAIDSKMLLNRLKELEREVAFLSVPLSYAGELYHLRLHLGFRQERIEKIAGQSSQQSA